MKIIEGFHINQILYAIKKEQDYINCSKRYVWTIPERLEDQINKGDIVWVHIKNKGKDFKTRVLVINILEHKERHLRSVINIDKKYRLR